MRQQYRLQEPLSDEGHRGSTVKSCQASSVSENLVGEPAGMRQFTHGDLLTVGACQGQNSPEHKLKSNNCLQAIKPSPTFCTLA